MSTRARSSSAAGSRAAAAAISGEGAQASRLGGSGRSARAAARIALFPRGLDGLFLPQPRDRELLLLVERGRPEARWAERFAGARVVPYSLQGEQPLQELTTGEALARSNIGAALREAGAGALFLHGSRTPDIDAWARRERVRLVAARSRWARALEHKIRFDTFLAEHRIARPRSVNGRAGRLDPLPFARGAVAQKPDSMGGEGTFFLGPREPLRALIDAGVLRANEPCLVRELVHGRPLGITVLVAQEVVALSALRLQCYYPGDGPSRAFAGIQWLPRSSLSRRLAARIERLFLALGRTLHQRGYRGFANVDFLCGADERPYVIECNPRPSAATPALWVWPELISDLPAAELYFDALLSRARAARLRTLGLPRSEFAGATLDVQANTRDTTPRSVRRGVESGVYRMSRTGPVFLDADPQRLGPPGTLFAYASIRRGERFAFDATLVNVCSSFPLYDARGRLNARGRAVYAAFEVS
jgi:hypothetical protein